jgi:hypothetical protein
MYDAAVSATAWDKTAAFLAEHLPVS